jgi:hypothetical protein
MEWDFEGVGDFPLKEAIVFASGTQVEASTSYAFAKPGVYFPSLRAIIQRRGDIATPHTRIANLGRVRVVVA